MRDDGRQRVVDEAIYYGQYDIAFRAANAGEFHLNQSEMVAEVALCMAREGWSNRRWFVYARQMARRIEYHLIRDETNYEISELEHSSIRSPAPELCRKVNWFRAPSDGDLK